MQLSSLDGVSDHDPVSDDEFVVFERFPKDTAYNSDVEAGFIHWDLIEVDMATQQESILYHDGFINWLPVYSPNGNYVVHLRTVTHTEAHLIDRQGQPYGRLIPNVTKIRYIDWK